MNAAPTRNSDAKSMDTRRWRSKLTSFEIAPTRTSTTLSTRSTSPPIIASFLPYFRYPTENMKRNIPDMMQMVLKKTFDGDSAEPRSENELVVMLQSGYRRMDISDPPPRVIAIRNPEMANSVAGFMSLNMDE